MAKYIIYIIQQGTTLDLSYLHCENQTPQTEKIEQITAETQVVISENEGTKNRFLEVEHNSDEVWRIMGNFVTGSSRNQYNNGFLFVMWIFDNDKPPNTRLLDPCILGEVYPDHCREINNKC